MTERMYRIADQKPRLVSFADAVAEIGIPAGTARDMVRDGQLAHVKIRRRIYIPRVEIDRLCTPSASETGTAMGAIMGGVVGSDLQNQEIQQTNQQLAQ